MPKGFHRTDFSVARDGDLARWEQSLGDFALRALEQCVDLARIETDLARMLCNLMGCRHCLSSWLSFRN
jgi:hypothetical protein